MVSYKKTFENDIFFFLPMTASNSPQAFARIAQAASKLSEAAAGAKGESYGNSYCRILNDHVLYECNSNVFRKLNRFYLGEFSLACYDDNYDGTVIDVEKVHIFVTAHKETGLYIVTLGIHDNHYIPTQMIDQMSTNHLDLLFGDDKVSVANYMAANFGLSLCGDSKCVVCMSNYPEDKTELGYMLSGETYVSEHIDYHIRPERMEKLLQNRACYDYYDSYISRSVVAFVFNEYDQDLCERLEVEASVLFVVEIVLFQNTAVLRTNEKVIGQLDDNSITNPQIEELYLEFGRTMKFWSSDVFKYPFSQMEADEIVNSFGISKALDEYHRNQAFIDRLIEIKGNLSSDKSNGRMNFILFLLALMQGIQIFLALVTWFLTTILHMTDIVWYQVGSAALFLIVTLVVYIGLVVIKKK